MTFDCTKCDKKCKNPQALNFHVKFKHTGKATEVKKEQPTPEPKETAQPKVEAKPEVPAEPENKSGGFFNWPSDEDDPDEKE